MRLQRVSLPLLIAQTDAVCPQDIKIVGYPVCIEDDKYHRNALLFNIGFVFDKDADAAPYKPILRKLGALMESMEKEMGFLSKESTKATLSTILPSILHDLTMYGESTTTIDPANIINLKVFQKLPPPPDVFEHQVPVAIRDLHDLLKNSVEWDLALQKIVPHIDGVNYVKRIAIAAEVDVAIGTNPHRELAEPPFMLHDFFVVKNCIRQLLYYGCITMIDIFMHSNIYATTSAVHSLVNDLVLQVRFSTRDGFEHHKLLAHIDVRRLITFGLIHGILRRIHRYPVIIDRLSSRPPQMLSSSPSTVSLQSATLTNGSNAVMAIRKAATPHHDLSAMYELCIYTHGTRKYAEKIADIIDPTRKLFNGRIISRSDTPDIGHKDLKFLFPSCDDSMIIILDDRVDVWRKNYENVFIIEAFHFFNTRAELNNASGGKDSAGGIRILPKGDTHLEKTFRAVEMKNVVVVNPQWLVDSASEWSKQDEAKYEVKFILTSAQQDREAADGASKAGDDGVGNEEAGQDAEATTSSRKGGEVVVPSSSDRPEGTEDPAVTQESDEGGASSEIATLYDEIDHNIEDAEALKSQNTEATIPSPEDVSPQPQSVKGILSAPETIGQKPKKSVRFTPDVKEPTVQFQNLPMRHRVMHRKGPLPARVTPAGVVESGGSFEFVQRIAKLKAKASPAAALPKFNRVAIPAQVPIAARTKKEESVDDIMDKWANMEDEEEVQQPKRKSALFQEKHAEAAKRAKRQLKEEAPPPPAADDADDDEGVVSGLILWIEPDGQSPSRGRSIAVVLNLMGKAKFKKGRVHDEDSDTAKLTGVDLLEDSSPRPSIVEVGSVSCDDTTVPLDECEEIPSSMVAPMPSTAQDNDVVVSLSIHQPRISPRGASPAVSNVPVDLVECDDTIDEDDYNFRIKYRTEMTWQLVYVLIWNLLARHAWAMWIEFAGVVLAYSVIGLFGSLNPTRYPASWCLWSVRCYLWLNPVMQVYNALWLGRLFFLDNVFWFTYVTMLLNFGVLYCGYVSASEYYDNDLVHFMRRHFAASAGDAAGRVDANSIAVDIADGVQPRAPTRV
ncbi:hypothetical protein DYB32_001039 [Aphanomyces invadans]|uniref:FCP1 homology domain-containing protein n=1 Tax=Aphanomyces invadans TaxID=157072 RepID=A0A418B7Y0_9STRA|nr:hypothetical protein DYB32_001039 [Aphanomyces invadans]